MRRATSAHGVEAKRAKPQPVPRDRNKKEANEAAGAHAARSTSFAQPSSPTCSRSSFFATPPLWRLFFFFPFPVISFVRVSLCFLRGFSGRTGGRDASGGSGERTKVVPIEGRDHLCAEKSRCVLQVVRGPVMGEGAVKARAYTHKLTTHMHVRTWT